MKLTAVLCMLTLVLSMGGCLSSDKSVSVTNHIYQNEAEVTVETTTEGVWESSTPVEGNTASGEVDVPLL